MSWYTHTRIPIIGIHEFHPIYFYPSNSRQWVNSGKKIYIYLVQTHRNANQHSLYLYLCLVFNIWLQTPNIGFIMLSVCVWAQWRKIIIYHHSGEGRLEFAESHSPKTLPLPTDNILIERIEPNHICPIVNTVESYIFIGYIVCGIYDIPRMCTLCVMWLNMNYNSSNFLALSCACPRCYCFVCLITPRGLMYIRLAKLRNVFFLLRLLSTAIVYCFALIRKIGEIVVASTISTWIEF